MWRVIDAVILLFDVSSGAVWKEGQSLVTEPSANASNLGEVESKSGGRDEQAKRSRVMRCRSCREIFRFWLFCRRGCRWLLS